MRYLEKFEDVNELKKYLKPKHPYGSKTIKMSKVELDKICQKLNIKDIEYISSGSYGDAYSFDDKVMKITTDKREAKFAYDFIGVDDPHLIKYYNVYRYEKYYVIIMDKVTPLKQYLRSINYKNFEFLKNLIYIIRNYWFDDIYGQIVLKIYRQE